MKVTIVGAGIVGCAIAHELARRGVDVRVIDPRGTGEGATRASAGILAPHIEGHHDSLLSLCLCSLEIYDAFIGRVGADSHHPIEYERTGTLQIAREAGAEAALETASRQLAQRGVAHRLLGRDDARRLEPALSPAVTAALLVPQHGYVDAQALTAALGTAAQRRGARFATERVLALETARAGVQVVTDAGPIQGDAVVVAAGSWSSQLMSDPSMPPAVTPIRGQLVHLRLAAPILSRVVWGADCYVVPRRDGLVLVGATVEDVGFDERTTAAGVEHLLGGGITLIPALAAAAFGEVRVGLRPQTSDELPVIGRSSTMPSVFYATGHYRNGVLLAPLTAGLVADLVLDGRERPELALVRPDRFGL